MSSGGGPALVIFDCDGVLVDSEPIANRILAEALTRAGHPTTVADALERYVGRSMAAVAAMVEAESGLRLSPEFLAALEKQTFAGLRKDLKPIAGIEAALDRIAAPVCVASSGAPAKIALSLSLTGLGERFGDRVFSASMVVRGKPAPDLFLLAAARLGAVPGACVVVEDSVPGIAAARAAGMRALGFVGGGHAGPDLARRLAEAGAEVFADMALLPSLLR